jgi:hypothetical protein
MGSWVWHTPCSPVPGSGANEGVREYTSSAVGPSQIIAEGEEEISRLDLDEQGIIAYPEFPSTPSWRGQRSPSLCDGEPDAI